MDLISPLIIPRSEHNISRSILSANAIHSLYRLKRNDFTSFLVGGCVRDLLLGREPKDFDLVTNATPGQIKKLFRNCRLVGRRFRLAHLHFADEIIEVATFRALGLDEPDDNEPLTPNAGGTGAPPPVPRHLKSDEGVLLRDNVFGTPEEDARRRDFTVNALFYDIGSFSIIDYCGGIADLKLGIIRTIGPPAERFTEDPVRMLRAVRFSAVLGFNIEDATWDALVSLSATITRAAPPRLYEEMLKLFLCGEGEKGYQLMRQSGLFAALFPTFGEWLDLETEGFPHTWTGAALDWLDRQTREREKVTPHLLLALIFGEYLEEKGAILHGAGMPPQQALDAAVAGFLGELAGTVLIPHRIGMKMRDILACQRRFRKTPGKHPLSFITRPCFAEAFAYFRFICGISGEGSDLLKWWDDYILANGRSSQAEATGEREQVISTKPARRRRRKRRRKRGDGQQSP